MKKCTGVRCLMQAGTVDPDNCGAVEYCPQATPPETSGPTIYERQIQTNQAVIMGALAELMPNEGADQLLENLYVSALQTMKILKEADKEKEA